MAVALVMPQLGESVVEGTLTRWLVKEGQRVERDQAMAEISTDKVDTEIEAPAGGVVIRLLTAEGQTVAVGTELALIGEAAEAAGAAAAAPAASAMPAAAASAVPAAAHSAAPAAAGGGRPAPPAAAGDGPARSQAAPAGPKLAVPRVGPATSAPPTQPSVRFSPVVLKMAAEYQLDPARIPGTGLGGRVTKRDVERYLAEHSDAGATPQRQAASAGAGAGAPAPAALPSPVASPQTFRPPIYQPQAEDQIEPFTRRRKIIAEHMVFSKTHSPHVGTVAEVDMTRVAKLRDSHKQSFLQREGFALTILPIVVAATARALREFPRMNGCVVGDSLVVRKQINIGVAVDTEAGLVVPVVRDADQKSVLGLAREINAMARRATEGSLGADQLAGGSFTVTNPGREGNLFGFAIINQPQLGILRMGEIKKTPVVMDVDGADVIAVRQIMYLALSYDHRVIDGVLGNRFLFRVGRILEAGEFTV